MKPKIANRKEAEALLLEKAERDDAFRRELIANPKAVIARELDMPLPPNVNVRVVEETARELVLVLPPKATGRGELDDSDLEAVAGGAFVSTAQKANTSPLKQSTAKLVPGDGNFGSGGFTGGV
jgi:hypothetical protein